MEVFYLEVLLKIAVAVVTVIVVVTVVVLWEKLSSQTNKIIFWKKFS
jgi:hypothetical protein